MSEAAVEKKETPVVIYDAEATNHFDLEVRHIDGNTYDTTHVYGPLSDDRYLQWLNEFHIKGTGGDDVSEEAREASVRLWDDTIQSLGNVEIAEGQDFREFIDSAEKVESVNKFLAVAIGDSPNGKQTGKRILGQQTLQAEQIIVTEAWFNKEISVQEHFLRPRSIELQKKYARIQGKRFKQEQTRGLRRKPKIEFIPQDARIGEMYDEMVLRTEGFARDVVPLRFKTAVIHHVFDDTVSEKKQQP